MSNTNGPEIPMLRGTRQEIQRGFFENCVADSVNVFQELQLSILELREQLICVQIGREEALAAERDLRAQLLEHAAHAQRQDAALAGARTQLQRARYQPRSPPPPATQRGLSPLLGCCTTIGFPRGLPNRPSCWTTDTASSGLWKLVTI